MFVYMDFIYVSFKHTIIYVTSSTVTPNSIRIIYNTSLLTKSQASLESMNS
jgi:hypothetical protein